VQLEEKMASSPRMEGTSKYINGAFDFIPIATAIIDIERRIMAWNRECGTLTGIIVSRIAT